MPSSRKVERYARALSKLSKPPGCRRAANLHGKRYAELWAERPLGSGSKWLVPADSERLASEDPVAEAAPQGQGEITWLTTL
jgi:hypothetical protein